MNKFIFLLILCLSCNHSKNNQIIVFSEMRYWSNKLDTLNKIPLSFHETELINTFGKPDSVLIFKHPKDTQKITHQSFRYDMQDSYLTFDFVPQKEKYYIPDIDFSTWGCRLTLANRKLTCSKETKLKDIAMFFPRVMQDLKEFNKSDLKKTVPNTDMLVLESIEGKDTSWINLKFENGLLSTFEYYPRLEN